MVLVVNSLGKFQIVSNNGVLNDDNIRSDMMKKLLVYVLLHRDHPLTVSELCNALWQEDEIDNPANALKNLMYRVRNLFKSKFGDAEFIVSKKGSYSWNEKVEVIFDCSSLSETVRKQRMLI